ncbi:hypothetical protein B9X54_16735 [Acinetobacter baumannii]|uniref:hypothetical protein n=1 Tax=Acinetobacter baumannii TaxID=470 RepID=UPI000A3344C1|nr:hypothetical protein [Acinetobacter baumannii]OTM08726.1 hypothetical protein B9X54_16735 [Acinetobacter baumannii]
MAEEIITREELVDAKVDAKDLGECVNGNETGIVTPRYGEAYPTLPKAIEKIENTGGYISAPTLAVLNAIMPSYNYQLARVDATGDEYRWNPAATPTPLWEPTGRNFLNDSKAYAENITSINLYRGNSAHNTPFNSSTFDKTTTKIDYGSTGFRYKNANLTGGVNIPFNGELRSKVQVWVKVTSAALNSGTMRFLVQAIKNDGTNFLSQYTNIPDGTVGWFKLAEVALSEANRAVFNRVTITPQVISGADLSGNDYYVGESVPTVPFVRVREPLDRIIARTATRKSLLPTWKSYPAATGVTINENGDITIAPGISYPITFTVENASRINYCGYIDQVATGDCRLFFRGYRAATPTTFHDVPYFPTSIGGIEFLGAVQFDALVSSVQLTINNYSTTDSITLRSFDICYDPVATNGKLKIGDRLDLTKVKSEVIQAVAANKPQKNFSSFPDWSVVAKSSDGKRYALNGIAYSEPVALGNIQTEKRYYVSMPDSVATLGTGTAKLTLYHVKADGNSLGGVSSSITATGMINASITTTAETTAILLRIDLTGDAKVELGRLIISEVPYSSETVFDDLFKEDITGTMLSDWEYPNLSGFTKYGDQTAEYPITEDADGEKVLSIPVTSSTIQYGQGAKFIVNMPADQSKQVVLSFLAKSQYDTTNPTRIWLRLFREGSTAEMTASVRNMVINRDGSWTLNQINIPRNVGAYVVKYAEVFLLTDNTSVVPLQLKRFIQTVGSHNPFVKFIKNANEKPATGLSDFLRLKDALAEQPQTVFSVGRQLFRPLKTVQDTVADYELINGQSLLPKRLYNLRHIDTDGYLIAFIDRDDTVYLRKGAALYKTSVDDLNSRCVATSTVGSEKRGVFNSSGLTLINANAPGGWLRITGDGTFVIVNKTSAYYSIDGGLNWSTASGYQDVNGEHYNAWGTDCVDNVVITSGYRIAGANGTGRGTGRVNYSNDNGKTYQVILDIETSSFIDNARRGSMHIHSVKYDPYWDGVWVVMGDGAFNNPGTSVTSNVWFIENPGTAQQNMISYDCRGQDWTNEQHVSVFPMQDCILFGSDAAPTGLYRMARTKDVKAFRDVAVPISTALSHYGCGGYQHQHYLPAAIYFGKAGESTVSLNDKVFLTYDGVNIVEIYTEPETSNMPSGKVNSFAFALDKYFIFERRTDARFASGNTWIISDIQYMR